MTKHTHNTKKKLGKKQNNLPDSNIQDMNNKCIVLIDKNIFQPQSQLRTRKKMSNFIIIRHIVIAKAKVN